MRPIYRPWDTRCILRAENSFPTDIRDSSANIERPCRWDTSPIPCRARGYRFLRRAIFRESFPFWNTRERKAIPASKKRFPPNRLRCLFAREGLHFSCWTVHPMRPHAVKTIGFSQIIYNLMKSQHTLRSRNKCALDTYNEAGYSEPASASSYHIGIVFGINAIQMNAFASQNRTFFHPPTYNWDGFAGWNREIRRRKRNRSDDQLLVKMFFLLNYFRYMTIKRQRKQSVKQNGVRIFEMIFLHCY